MGTREWLIVVGWLVTFILGIASGYIVLKLTAKRKVLAWATSEVDVIPSQLSKIVGIPVNITVGNESISSLSIVKVKIGNVGNDTIEDFNTSVHFNKDCKILDSRVPQGLGAYSDKIQWTTTSNSTNINFKFLNPGISFQFEFTLSSYKPGYVDVGCAAPGVVIKKESGEFLETELARSLLGFSIGILGASVRYDPTVVAMREVAEEIRRIGREIRKPIKGDSDV